ncbi:MAG: hypothetical protein PHP31_02260 [Lentimicrobiaceae bacterium]|nr:hypothetical protein [Lentimicrobiaceae bacterium]
MKSKISDIWNIYKIVLLLCLLQSFRAWFFWGISDLFASLLLLLFGLFLSSLHKTWFVIDFKLIIHFLLLLIASFLTSRFDNINSILLSIIRILPILFIITLKNSLKIDLYIFVRKCFSILLLISLIGWIIFLLGVNIPSSIVYYGYIDNLYHYSYTNYYLFLNNNATDYVDYYRFCSVFLEPGYLGCLLSVFLFLDRYRFNKINFIFYLSLFFTFSVAGWLITIIGYILYSLKNSKRKFLWLIMIITIYFSTINIAQNYNSGDNWVNNAVISRLQYDDEKGLSGYNRSSETTDQWFWDYYIYEKDFLWGSSSKIDNIGVDWKTYIILYGFIGFIFYILYLIFPLFDKSSNKYELLIYFIIYSLIFAQTIHGIYWLLYLFLYIVGIAVINNYPKSNLAYR